MITTIAANVPDDLRDFVLIADPTIERAELEWRMNNLIGMKRRHMITF